MQNKDAKHHVSSGTELEILEILETKTELRKEEKNESLEILDVVSHEKHEPLEILDVVSYEKHELYEDVYGDGRPMYLCDGVYITKDGRLIHDK